jgi:thiol-disulfide isomerase/thioredoxin
LVEKRQGNRSIHEVSVHERFKYDSRAVLSMKILNHLAWVLWFTGCLVEAQGENTAGVGLVLGVDGQHIIVRNILPNSPAAAQSTLRVGDRIVAVAQGAEAPVELKGGKLAQAVPLLRGATGTTVRLTIVPAGEDDSQARVVTFVRGELEALARWGDGVLLARGEKVPDIEMVRLTTGRTERLSDYAGQIIVLEFWATWCGPCQPKLAELQSYSAKYPDWKGKVVLIAASVDDRMDMAAKHLETKGWKQTHNVWVQPDAIKACHVEAIPTAYIIDREGRILAVNPASIPEIVNRQLQEERPGEANEQ